MNDAQSTNGPQIPSPISPEEFLVASPPSRRWTVWDWLRRLLGYNPFFLISAGLLLYGIYRVSVDPNFLSRDTSQLIFNYSSLQVYESMLVAVAILLARRFLWYDATLLAGLENLLVLVPFILTSEAGLMDVRYVW